jgi:hypothetical protein
VPGNRERTASGRAYGDKSVQYNGSVSKLDMLKRPLGLFTHDYCLAAHFSLLNTGLTTAAMFSLSSPLPRNGSVYIQTPMWRSHRTTFKSVKAIIRLEPSADGRNLPVRPYWYPRNVQ